MTHVIESLPILILYPHSRCNCRCIMCDIWKVDSAQEISLADLERHGADIEKLGVQRVVLSGGEPLMHSDLFRLCGFLRNRGIRVTILTTGLLLKRNAEKLIDFVDDVIVSLDGPPEIHDRIRRLPGAFELLAEGVGAIHRLRPGFPIAARSTVQRQNCGTLRETARTAHGLGLRSISFLAADLTSSAFNRERGWTAGHQAEVGLTVAEVAVLENEIEALVMEWGETGFVLEKPQKLRAIARHFRSHLGLIEPVAPLCSAPWVSAVIESDGTVRPCFFHPLIGKVGERSLLEVLNGPEAVAFRANLDVETNPVCRRCVCSLNFKASSLSSAAL